MSAEKSKSNKGKWDSWITAIEGGDREKTLDSVSELVCKRKIFGFSKGGVARISPGDKICFHAIRVGIVADAIVSSTPVLDRKVISPFYPWVFNLKDVKCYIDKPIVLDLSLRKRMDAFIGRDPEGNWTWFIKHVHRVSDHDFKLLTNSLHSQDDIL